MYLEMKNWINKVKYWWQSYMLPKVELFWRSYCSSGGPRLFSITKANPSYLNFANIHVVSNPLIRIPKVHCKPFLLVKVKVACCWVLEKIELFKRYHEDIDSIWS